jgi:hypothetical protein
MWHIWYNLQNGNTIRLPLMRRSLSSALIAIFWAGILLPSAFATFLPASLVCCRRSGTHHCESESSAGLPTAPTLRAAQTCPFHRGASLVSKRVVRSRRDAAEGATLLCLARSLFTRQQLALTLSFLRNQHERAPPRSLLLA